MNGLNAGTPPGQVSRAPFAGALRGDDRILPEVKLIVAAIIPFVVVGWVILYFFPGKTAEWFAWNITPQMTALQMGAGYIAGTLFLVRIVLGRKWHEYAFGFPAITAFTWFSVVATFLHIDRFNFSTNPLAVYVWIALYIITPLAVPLLWLRNRPGDPLAAEAGDLIVSDRVRWANRLVGIALLGVALFIFIAPDAAISIWPWKLTLLTARIIASWFALPGVLGIVLSMDARWSAWRFPLESQALGVALVLLGVMRARGDFDSGKITTWIFVGGLALLLLGLLTLYASMEVRARSRA